MKQLLVALGLFAAVGSTAAQSPANALRDTIDARSAAFFKTSPGPGLAVGVWKNGQVIFAGGYGAMEGGGQERVTPATVFHLASISKTFVATAVMQLVEQGKVRLDDPVVKHVPYFRLKDSRADSVTIRQVMSHTAGMPDVDDYDWDHPQYDDQALERWIRGLRDSSSIAAPAAKWEYSNIGFELLAHLIAVVSRESFEGYVQRNILTPAGMKHSTFLMTDVDSAHLATGHEMRGGTLTRQRYPYNRRHAGSSTMHSSIEDMLRYGAMHANRGTIDGKRVLQASSYAEMWKAQTDISRVFMGSMMLTRLAANPLKKVEMGLGWFLMDFSGVAVSNHDGGDRGFRSTLLIAPDRQVVVVVLTNGPSTPQPLALSLLDAALR